MAIGGDCVQHYLRCPHMLAAVEASGVGTPTWARADINDDVFMMRLWPEHAIGLDAIWRYLFYMTYTQACADGCRWDNEDVA